jgi:predicted dehydrogenase
MGKKQLNKLCPVRFGLLGCGMIANYHARAVRGAGGILAGACSYSGESASRFCREHYTVQYDDYASMLSDGDIDAVVVCTPSGQHAAQTIKALRAGKHAVVEKPMCITLAEADEIIRVSEETGKLVCVISQMRFAEGVRAAKLAVENGWIGKIVCASLSMQYYRSDAYYAQAAWRGTWAQDGGGCLMNQGIHGIDAFRYILGPVDSLSGYIATRTHDIEVEDTACAVLQMKNGALATLDASTSSKPGYPRRITICGERGSFVLEDQNIVRWDVSTPSPVRIGSDMQNAAVADPNSLDPMVHVPQYRNFLAALCGEESLVIGAREGREPLSIIVGIYRASITGRVVKIDNSGVLSCRHCGTGCSE